MDLSDDDSYGDSRHYLSTSPESIFEVDSLAPENLDSHIPLSPTSSFDLSSSSSKSTSPSSENLEDDRALFTSPTTSIYDSPVHLIQSSSTESELGDLSSSPPDHEFFSFPSFRPSSDDHSLSDFAWQAIPQGYGDFSPPNHTSAFLSEDTFSKNLELVEPGTSANTIRPGYLSNNSWDSFTMRRSAIFRGNHDNEAVDGSEWEDRRGRGQSRWGGEDGGNGSRTNGGSDGYGQGGSGWHANGAGRGGDDDGGDDPHRPPGKSSFSGASSSDEDSEEEEDSDDYGEPSKLVAAPSQELASSDDDVPLAKSIPTALKAQRTIRIRAREEREQRRKDRAARSEDSRRPRQTTLRPSGAGHSQSPPTALSSTQEAALHASRSMHRNRAQTLAGVSRPFPVEDLNKKLQQLQTADSSSYGPPPVPPTRERERPRSSGQEFSGATVSSPQQQEPVRTLRLMRSLHQLQGRPTFDHTFPVPANPEPPRLARTPTRPRTNTRDEPKAPAPPAIPKTRAITLSPDRSPRSPRASNDLERKQSNRLVKSARASSDQTRPPLPPMPVAEIMQSRGVVSQQRVFIGDMQRFNMVEIDPSTTAGDVVRMVDDQGSLKGWVGSGGWMLWEVAQDFGMGEYQLYIHY